MNFLQFFFLLHLSKPKAGISHYTVFFLTSWKPKFSNSKYLIFTKLDTKYCPQ